MSNQPSPPSAPSSAPAGDPFQRLKKMSKTAGVGTQEYVAINAPSIVCLLAGVAALLALLSPILLAFAAFSVVCGVIAWVQVVKSGGTQMGRRFAAIGLLLSFGVTGLISYREYADARAFEESKSAIADIFTKFGSAAAAGDGKTAYSYFGSTFHERIKFEDFDGFLKMLEGNTNYGGIKNVEWNQRLEAIPDTSGQGNDIARAMVGVRLAKAPNTIPAEATLIRRTASDGRKGDWKIESLAPFFEKPASRPSPQGQGSGG